MLAILSQLDAVLRGTIRTPRQAAFGTLLAGAAAASFCYGAVMGGFSFSADAQRLFQMLFSAIKVPLLLMVTFGLCVPSYFVLNTLAGLRDDFGHALRALLTTQCALAIVLVSLSPLTLVWYLSDAAYDRAILFNATMFAVSSLAAQRVLHREYRPLVAKNSRHRLMVRIWLIMYAFVGIQMGWVLRPFIGKPGLPARFFRDDAWGNAYEQVIQLIWKLGA